MSPYIKVQKVTNKMPDQATPYYCELCDFKSSKKSNYDIHLTTAKHKKVTNDDINQSIKCHICQCGKEFKYRQGLSRHRKKCFEPGQIEPPPQPSSQVDMTVVLELLKQNQECEDYFKFYKSALGGYDKEEDKKFEDKIIKNVLKEVLLDKSITDAE